MLSAGMVVPSQFVVYVGFLLCCLSASRHLSEVAEHPLRIRPYAREQSERLGRLEHRHSAAIERAAAQHARLSQQLGLQRKVDDIGNPEIRPEQIYRQWQTRVL